MEASWELWGNIRILAVLHLPFIALCTGCCLSTTFRSGSTQATILYLHVSGPFTRPYSKNSSRDSPENSIPQLLVISADTGSSNLKVVSTGNDNRKLEFLFVEVGSIVWGITSAYQIDPIKYHFLNIVPLGCREPARNVGGELARNVTVKKQIIWPAWSKT